MLCFSSSFIRFLVTSCEISESLITGVGTIGYLVDTLFNCSCPLVIVVIITSRQRQLLCSKFHQVV